jgi:hypothetical protein
MHFGEGCILCLEMGLFIGFLKNSFLKRLEKYGNAKIE